MSVVCVMLSCHSRSGARAVTIPQLVTAGLEPVVFLDSCRPNPRWGNDVGNKRIGAKALTWALGASDGHVLVVEDDIDLAPDFPQALNMALQSNATTYFYLNEEASRMKDIYGQPLARNLLAKKPTPLTLTPAREYVGLFGTQCVLLPRDVAVAVLEFIPRARKAFDAALWTLLSERRLAVNVVTPNVAQHRHDRTGRIPDSSVKRSLSFDCPRMPP